MVDYKKLLETIKQDEAKNFLAIIQESETDVLTDDFTEDRIINYHLAPPSEEWLRERFLWTKGCASDQRLWEDVLIQYFTKLPSEAFLTLNRVIAIRTAEDILEACEVLGVDEDEFPSCIDPEEADYVGCRWHYMNSIILDFHAIDACNQDLAKEYGTEVFSLNTHEGVVLTAIHEIRHQMLDGCPYDVLSPAPQLEDFEEDGVENWARTQYEKIRNKL